MKKAIFALFLCACLAISGVASADNDARDYIPAPAGTILSLLYYFHVSGDSMHTNGNETAKINFTENLGMWREVFFFNLGPFIADAQLVVPFGNASLDIPGAGVYGMSSSGISDPMILGTIWFVNRPQSKTWLGFSPYFFLPVGNYSDSQTVNMGSNRWAFREELVFTQGFEVIPNHNAYFEVTVGGDFFTDNTDYIGGTKLGQDPIFNLESHLSYDLTKDWWISADFYSHWGGRQSVDSYDVENSKVNSQTVGGTLAYNLSPSWQILFQYKGDVAVQNGIPAQTFQTRLCYITDFGKLFK
ncbi:MAG: transporter [Syntrophobacter sp.]